MKYIIKESQYVHLLENLEKNKKFLTNLMGIDFTGKIKQVTSSYDVPMEFDDVIGPDGIRRYLNFWGPMYLIEIDGMRFLYQDRVHTDVRFEWFLGEDGIDYVDNEIPEKLGIDIIGLRFSDILDMYFNEEETLNESTDKNKKFLTNHMGIDFTGKFKKITRAFDIPYNFFIKGGITLNHAMSYLNAFGPMYFFELGDYEYVYQDRGNKDWFIDERGVKYTKDEFSERLGLDVLGFRFSDIIKMYFNEGEVVTEDEDKVLRSRVQRRLGFIDQYMSELDPNDVCDYWMGGEVDYYVISSMQNAVEKVCNEIGNYDLYDEIYEYLADNGYKSQFRDFFIDTKNNFC